MCSCNHRGDVNAWDQRVDSTSMSMRTTHLNLVDPREIGKEKQNVLNLQHLALLQHLNMSPKNQEEGVNSRRDVTLTAT